MTSDYSRREFLAQATAAIAVADSPLAFTTGCGESREQPTELSATAAIAAMKNGDMKAEDYARREGMSRGEVERWLASNLAYDPE